MYLVYVEILCSLGRHYFKFRQKKFELANGSLNELLVSSFIGIDDDDHSRMCSQGICSHVCMN
jgi:hypothetical protein